jgi:hypothetical protein
VSPVRYELSFYIPEDGVLHSQRRENLKSYLLITVKFLSHRQITHRNNNFQEFKRFSVILCSRSGILSI